MALCLVASVWPQHSSRAAEHEFRYKAPDAQSVSVMGEFNGWKAVPMTKGADGTWTAKVSLPPGVQGYKFLVNGRDWVFDPGNAKRKTVDGVENSAAEAGATGTAPAAGTASTPFPTTTPRPAATAAAAIISPTPRSGLTSAQPSLNPTPGEVFTFEAPLSAKRQTDAARADHGHGGRGPAKQNDRKLERAKVAIAVPVGFDPQKSWPVLVVSNTQQYSNIDAMGQFRQAALAEGWVVLAADDIGAENGKEGGNREACTGAAFDYLESAWPAVRNWPVACGGMSGGAKNSGFMAAYLGREGRRIIGMLMMGCNQDMASVAMRQGAPPPNFRQAAVFLSSGKDDTIATPAHHERVKDSLRGNGFRKLRLESFDGAHVVHEPHVGEALRWFVAQASGASAAGSATPRPSELDSFLKKNR